MKIGIVTIMDYTNFGNRLQNYAVSQFLRTRFGCNVVTLAVDQEKPFHNGNFTAWMKEKIAMKLCVFPSMAEKRFGVGITRVHNFRSWSKRYIPTKNYYEHKRLPDSLSDRYDRFFVGSDQIWNYRFSSNRFDDFFLSFTKDKKKAAISGSFGLDEIPEEWKQVYVDGLSSFSHISVREDAGAQIIKDLLGWDVPVLVDPVMLLSQEEWLKVAKRPRVNCSKPYILKYYLGDEAEEEKIDHWAKENGYEVYELLNDKIPELYSAGPGEFISLIHNAALVCSDSFHCIAFSVIFRKPFVVYSRLGSENNMTSRLDTLLGKFGFQNRWKHLLSPEQYLSCDYSKVEKLMEDEQEKALTYIRSVLNSN